MKVYPNQQAKYVPAKKPSLLTKAQQAVSELLPKGPTSSPEKDPEQKKPATETKPVTQPAPQQPQSAWTNFINFFSNLFR